jgi:ferredoxin
VSDRLHIDWVRCDGRGLCMEIVPELLVEDDWGFPLSRTRDAAPSVPVNVAVHARRAVKECPRLALTLRPDAG